MEDTKCYDWRGKAGAQTVNTSAWVFLSDPEEDIYTMEDGEEIK